MAGQFNSSTSLLPQGEKEEGSVHGIGLTGSRGQEITFRKFFSVFFGVALHFFGVAAMRVS
jgi:hypothetical protein